MRQLEKHGTGSRVRVLKGAHTSRAHLLRQIKRVYADLVRSCSTVISKHTCLVYVCACVCVQVSFASAKCVEASQVTLPPPHT